MACAILLAQAKFGTLIPKFLLPGVPVEYVLTWSLTLSMLVHPKAGWRVADGSKFGEFDNHLSSV